jgi:hypothetical protein
MDLPSFFGGFFFGFIVAGLLGSSMQNFRKAKGAMGAPDKPMNVPTSGTPRSVMKQAADAFRRMLWWGFVLLVTLGATAFVFYAILA